MLDNDLFKKYMELTPDADAYLERIGLSYRPPVSLEGLNALIEAHQKNVPFENYGICDHHYHVSLLAEDLFKKIVVERKGGYCFENNASFGSLLNALGFDVRPCACRIMMSSSSLSRIMHRGNIVTIDSQDFYCDVGFNGIEIPEAVEMVSGESSEHELLKPYLIPYDQCWWELHCVTPYRGRGVPEDALLLLINTSKLIPADFYASSDYCCTGADSMMAHNRMVYIRKDDGFVKLIGNVLTVVKGSDSIVTDISDNEVPEVMKEYFGVIY